MQKVISRGLLFLTVNLVLIVFVHIKLFQSFFVWAGWISLLAHIWALIIFPYNKVFISKTKKP